MGNTLMVDGEAMTNKDIGFVERRIKSHGLLGKHSTARCSNSANPLAKRNFQDWWYFVVEVIQSAFFHNVKPKRNRSSLFPDTNWDPFASLEVSSEFWNIFALETSTWFLLNRGSGAGPGWLVYVASDILSHAIVRRIPEWSHTE